MSGLEDVGIPGSNYLREALTSCTDPITAIEEFQAQNGILLPSLNPALPLLDLHGIKRLEFHSSVVEELRNKLMEQIKNLATENTRDSVSKLTAVLEKSFPLIKVPELQPVVMHGLKHMPKIKATYLQQILDDQELYNAASVEVKRQIWQDNQALFGDEVSPLLSEYITERENIIFNPESEHKTIFDVSPKARRQTKVVARLSEMIGKSVKLYDMVLQFLRTLFLRTRNVHYCTLRAEILMSLHDLDIHEICSVDPCHKFAWCLDPCIREKYIDNKRAPELQRFLDGLRKQEQVLGDLSMILCDPHAINTTCLTLLKSLQQSTHTETLPRENADVLLLLRLLSLGLQAWDIIDSQVFKEQKMDQRLVVSFLPNIMTVLVEDQIRNVTSRLPGDDEAADMFIGDLPASVIQYVNGCPIACRVILYYTLQAVKRQDKSAVCRVLPSIVNCENDSAYDDTFLHMLTSGLIIMADDFQYEDFCMAVFDDFFLPNLSSENVRRHLLRLLWFVHHKIPPVRMSSMLLKIKPSPEHSESVHNAYEALTRKVDNYIACPVVQETVNLDSPLMSVPAPTESPYIY